MKCKVIFNLCNLKLPSLRDFNNCNVIHLFFFFNIEHCRERTTLPIFSIIKNQANQATTITMIINNHSLFSSLASSSNFLENEWLLNPLLYESTNEFHKVSPSLHPPLRTHVTRPYYSSGEISLLHEAALWSRHANETLFFFHEDRWSMRRGRLFFFTGSH